jgi:hypothetical protein
MPTEPSPPTDPSDDDPGAFATEPSRYEPPWQTDQPPAPLPDLDDLEDPDADSRPDHGEQP